MGNGRTIQGRLINAADLVLIRDLIDSHPSWHRTRLSQELCRQWGWVNDKGRLKDIAARTLLRKLDAVGQIRLPTPVRSANNVFRHRCGKVEPLTIDSTPIRGNLRDLQPLKITVVSASWERVLFQHLLQRYHYLGYSGPVGENLCYLIRDRHDRPLGCLLYGAAAWRVSSRDEFIGWDEATRKQGLCLIANNHRFLILPWIKVSHLASHILALSRRQISLDWQEWYGHPVFLLETFVEQPRFTGVCYRADNWILVGSTAGRGRNHRSGDPGVPVKSVFIYPLCRDFRRRLSVFRHSILSGNQADE